MEATPIMNSEQSNLAARRFRVHFLGSEVRSLCISIRSSSVRLYFFSLGSLSAGINSMGYSLLRGSDSAVKRLTPLGRKTEGVLYGEGAEGAGLYTNSPAGS